MIANQKDLEMLILTRRPGESIIIDENIRVTYLGSNRGNQIRIGVEAPKDVTVHRQEIQDRINNQSNLTPTEV